MRRVPRLLPFPVFTRWVAVALLAAPAFAATPAYLLCTEGELHTELKDGRRFTLTAGMSYQVADHAEAHRSHTAVGAKLFIVD